MNALSQPKDAPDDRNTTVRAHGESVRLLAAVNPRFSPPGYCDGRYAAICAHQRNREQPICPRGRVRQWL